MFELFILEIIRELFREIRSESPLKLLDFDTTAKKPIDTRRKLKGFIDNTYSRTVVKRKSLANSLIRAYNWLKNWDLIPPTINELTRKQVGHYITNVLSVYIIDNKDLMALFY